MYKKHVRYTVDVKTVPITLGTPVSIGDWAKSAHTGFVRRIYVSDWVDGTVDILVNGKTIQSFTKEYVDIRKTLYTPTQKLLSDTRLTIIPCCPYLPCDNLEVLVDGQASPELIVEYTLIGTNVPRQPIVIEQVQCETFTLRSGSPVITRFLHEVKELFIAVDGAQLSRIRFATNEYIKVDQTGMYFHVTQPRDYHSSRAPSNVYTYSFCMDPESETYTGSIHMGRIQNQVFTFWGDAPVFTVRIYAISYNILDTNGFLEFVDS